MISLGLSLKNADGNFFRGNERKWIVVRPTMLTWVLSGCFVFGGFMAAVFLAESLLFRFLFIVGPVIVGIYLVGDFEDWRLDEAESKVVVSRYNILDWACRRVRTMHRFPLNDVGSVRSTDDFRLELWLSSGESAASITFPTTSRRDLENLRYSVSAFLCLEDTLVLIHPMQSKRSSRWSHFLKR